ncbi:MAG: transporter [Candidatus Eremiobacteraeota bacterium]|nr:transporter [Candidatus Eremiobacteraeota bacterium]
MARSIVLITLLLLACIGAAQGQNLYCGSGISASSTAQVLPHRSWQYFINYSKNDTGIDDFSFSPISGITYGLSPSCCVSVGFPYMIMIDGDTKAHGFKDMRGGFKYALTPREKDLKLTAVLGVKPQTTGNAQLSGNGATDYSGLLALTWDLPQWSFTANYGWDYWGPSGACPSSLTPFYSFMTTYIPDQKYTLAAEFYTQTPQKNCSFSTASGLNLMAGWHMDRQWEVNLGLSLGLNSQSTPRQYLISFSYTWGQEPAGRAGK